MTHHAVIEATPAQPTLTGNEPAVRNRASDRVGAEALVADGLVEQFELGLDPPIYLTWELTYACNLARGHCLSSSGRRDPRELTTTDAYRITGIERKRDLVPPAAAADGGKPARGRVAARGLRPAWLRTRDSAKVRS